MGMCVSATEEERPRTRGRPPIDEAAVLAAATKLVRRLGASRVTTNAIAEEAGVAKASLYRRWPTRAVLLAEALLIELRRAAPLDETIPPREAIFGHVAHFVRGLRGRLGRPLRGIVGECLADPAASAAFRDIYLGQRREAALRIIRRGVETGAFANGASAEDRHDELYGAIFYRFLFQMGDLGDEAAERLVEDVLVVRPFR